jgi:hypothetical protein
MDGHPLLKLHFLARSQSHRDISNFKIILWRMSIMRDSSLKHRPYLMHRLTIFHWKNKRKQRLLNKINLSPARSQRDIIVHPLFKVLAPHLKPRSHSGRTEMNILKRSSTLMHPWNMIRSRFRQQAMYLSIIRSVKPKLKKRLNPSDRWFPQSMPKNPALNLQTFSYKTVVTLTKRQERWWKLWNKSAENYQWHHFLLASTSISTDTMKFL